MRTVWLMMIVSPFIMYGCDISPPAVMKLSDPFLFTRGARMTTKDEWAVQRAEIADQAQAYEYGVKPGAPDSVSGSFNAGTKTLTVACTVGANTISFDCPIVHPAAGSGPFPAVIVIGGYSSLFNLILEQGAAVIVFPQDTIAQQENAGSRGQGLFYTLYGNTHSAGALMAWAWGVSRLIDALEKTPAAGINPGRLGVTGCSRNGKGALVCGAFDERIALTIPQESGAGGAAAWRVSEYEKALGHNVQTLSHIVTENCWFRSSFSQYGSAVGSLPFDHHMIEALCAPRALLVIENTGIDWLGPLSTWVTANTAHLVWEALGVPEAMGFSQVNHGGSHCMMPASQNADVIAFLRKYLLDQTTADTNIMKTDGGYGFDPGTWIDWTVPVLQ